MKGIRVVVKDLETGDRYEATIKDDYVLICDGTCYLDGTQASANGTHVLTIKGRKTR